MNILVAIQDSEAREWLLANLATLGHEAHAATDRISAMAQMRRVHPQVVIIGDLAEQDDVTLLMQIRNAEMPNYIYLIVLASDDQARTQHLLENGADDVLGPPLRREELQTRIGLSGRILHYERRLRVLEAQLHTSIPLDPLTGLLSRRAISDYARAELSRSHRDGKPISVLIFHVDDLENLQQSYGQDTADQMLRLVANQLSFSIRAYDRAGRWNDEQFMLVLPGASLVEAGTVADRIRAGLGVTGLLLPSRSWLHLTLSVGAVCALPEPRVTAEELIQHVEEAIQSSLQSGPNSTNLRQT